MAHIMDCTLEKQAPLSPLSITSYSFRPERHPLWRTCVQELYACAKWRSSTMLPLKDLRYAVCDKLEENTIARYPCTSSEPEKLFGEKASASYCPGKEISGSKKLMNCARPVREFRSGRILAQSQHLEALLAFV